MSKSAKVYGGAALILIVFPLLVALWGGTSSAVIAVLLIGAGAYGFAVCLLLGSFWHRYRHGTWPVEIGEAEAVAWGPSGSAAASENSPPRYRVSQTLESWVKKKPSNI